MSVNIEKVQAYRISGGELLALAQNVYKFKLNALSAFTESTGGTDSVSPEAMSLSDNENFKEAVGTLAQPSVKLTFKAGGRLIKPERFTVYGTKSGQGMKFVSLHEDNSMVLMLQHDNCDSFCGWFMSSYASEAVNNTINFIKPELPYETLLCIFNLIDLYKRKYLVDMLNFELNPPEEVYEDEFIALLEKGAISGDARWLMPALLVLVPGFENTTVEFLPEHLEYARNMDFFIHSKNPENGRPALLLGAPAQFMGMEFTHLWSTAIGLEISVLAGDRIKSRSRYFFAPTVETNHFITFVPTEEGKLNIKHESLTYEEMEKAFKKIIA